VKLWILSDWHLETRLAFDPPRPDFDVLVAAGDIEDSITRAIRGVAVLAGGKPSIFVAGNHEWHIRQKLGG
jgi:predicted phosphodiesterase